MTARRRTLFRLGFFGLAALFVLCTGELLVEGISLLVTADRQHAYHPVLHAAPTLIAVLCLFGAPGLYLWIFGRGIRDARRWKRVARAGAAVVRDVTMHPGASDDDPTSTRRRSTSPRTTAAHGPAASGAGTRTTCT